MRISHRIAVGLLAVLLLFATVETSSGAAMRHVRGKLNRSGYTVLAISGTGKMTAVHPGHKKFSLRLPGRVATLHLRSRRGVYAGPVVLRRANEGRRVVLGVKRGARLGLIRVRPRRGFAKVADPPPRKWIDDDVWGRAKRGVPRGARNFGYVRAKASRGTVHGDLDLDSVPAAIDIDVNGNLVLDNLDRSAPQRARTAQGTGCGPGGIYCHLTSASLIADLETTTNASVGSTPQEIDAAIAARGTLRIFTPSGGAELDCGLLVYCTLGGTGTVPDAQGTPSFPECCDGDGDGFGTMTPARFGAQWNDFFLKHGATTSQIGSGDLLIECDPDCTGGTQSPAPVQYVFATVPALVSYSDTAGHSATVSYPVAPGDPGTGGNGFPVEPGSNGEIVLTLTFHRPQRRPIAGTDPPTADWMDIGQLAYGVGSGCPASAISSTDPNLAPAAIPPHLNSSTGWLLDRKKDKPSSPTNTFTYTLNVTGCLAARGDSLEPGEEIAIPFEGASGTDLAQQIVFFTR